MWFLSRFRKTFSRAPLDTEVICVFEWSCKRRRGRTRETVRGDLGIIESLQNGFFNTRHTPRRRDKVERINTTLVRLILEIY